MPLSAQCRHRLRHRSGSGCAGRVPNAGRRGFHGVPGVAPVGIGAPASRHRRLSLRLAFKIHVSQWKRKHRLHMIPNILHKMTEQVRIDCMLALAVAINGNRAFLFNI